jgi:hypothetical protein
MFLSGNAEKALMGHFAPYPAEETETKELYSTRYVSKRADFLAENQRNTGVSVAGADHRAGRQGPAR